MANGLRFKGTMTVLVDNSRLVARLILSRSGEQEYDEAALARILSEAGVVGGYDMDALISAVKAFQKSKATSVQIDAAQGQPPVAPSGETWQWGDLPPLHGDRKALAARVLKAGGPPTVFRVRMEKVKAQKTVATKGGIFGGSHEEIQTVIENKEVREKVLVDPNPLNVFWVESGTRVATVSPPLPGRTGVDLGGNPIPIPRSRVSAFFVGANLARRKTEVSAAASGFLRVGHNWADILPHRDHCWSLTYSPDKTSAFFSFEPGDAEADPVSADSVAAGLTAEGF